MEKSSGLIVKMENKQFANFIASVLGKQQTITNSFRGAFEINIHDLVNTFHLVDQRIKQQNDSTLIQFRTKIIYDDESSILLGSINELETFNEIRKVIPISIHLEFDYLIKFQDKENPERQEIEISFVAIGTSDSNIGLLFEAPIRLLSIGGYINFSIKHTARTWGTDIESLLSNHLSNILKHENKIKKIIRKYNSKISLTISLLFLLNIFLSVYFATKKFALITTTTLKNELNKNLSNPIDSVNYKIDTIGNFLSSGIWAQYYFYVIVYILIGVILAILLGIWIDSSSESKEPSFILLTKESENQKIRIENKLIRKWISFVLSIISTIILGVIANILFNKIFC